MEKEMKQLIMFAVVSNVFRAFYSCYSCNFNAFKTDID